VRPDTPEVVAARIAAERARGQLMDTARELQVRLNPGTIANNAWADAKTKGADMAGQAVGAVKQRPGLAGAVVGALTLFMAREPLMEMAGDLKDKVTQKRQPKPSSRRAAKTNKSDQSNKKTETEDE
jgi:hypothetical protein